MFSYIRSRGFYAGISIMGQVFIGELLYTGLNTPTC